MESAEAGVTAGQDLAAVPDKLLQHVHVLVVNVVDLMDTEVVDLLAAHKASLLGALAWAWASAPCFLEGGVVVSVMASPGCLATWHLRS